MSSMLDLKNVFVHESSIVDEPCEIGEGTKIWHFCHVMRDAKLGRNCSLGQNVFVARGVVIGSNVKIQNNVSVYEGVELEDNVFCGPSVVFTNVINPRSEIAHIPAFPSNSPSMCSSVGEKSVNRTYEFH